MPPWRISLVALTTALALASVWFPRPPRRPAERVVLLGFDGADPQLLEALVARGRLPGLARLMRRGAWGPLRTFAPVKSAVLWTSIATGKTMAKHGIVDWTFADASGVQLPFEGTARRARTYWEILDEAGVSTGTLGWWLTSPPPALAHGYLVSDGYSVLPEEQLVSPPGLHAVLAPLLPRPRDVRREWGRFGLLEYRREAARIPPQAMAESILGAYRGYLLSDLTVDRLGDELRRRQPVEAFSTYFRVVDVTSHFGLHFVEPQVYEASLAAESAGVLPEEARARFDAAMAEAVLPAYRLMDHVVAKYAEGLDDRTLLIVCSDHGFDWYRGAYTHYHRAQEPPAGVLLMVGPGVRADYRLQGATLLDVAPTLLHALGQPVGEDMDGRVLERAFEPRWRERFPVRHVATHERARTAPPAEGRDPRLDQKVLEDLRTLGYIGAAEED
jgi:arylsulfatase A-like enzyme